MWAARIALALYLVPLARVTLWPESSQRPTWRRIHAASEAASSGRVDLHSTEMLANIAMFVPFGIIAAMVFRRFAVVLMAALALSSAIELAQHFWLPSRDGDIRDVALNVVGAALGCAFWQSGARLARIGRRAFGASSSRQEGRRAMERT